MKTSPGKVLRFTHLALRNWRNFSKMDVDLAKRVFLVGPNASGKSNFLDVFRFLRDVAAPGGGLQPAARIPARGGVSKLRCLAARNYSDITLHVTIGNDDTPTMWEYELSFSQDNAQRPVVKRERVLREGRELFPPRPNEEDKKDVERLTQTYLEQVNVNKEFRDVAQFLASAKYLHIVPQLVRDPNRSVGYRDDPYGGDFLDKLASTPEKTRNSRLERIREALKVAVPQLSDLELKPDSSGKPHLRGRYQHWRPQGNWQTEEQFSDGTLRLMGLLWSLLEGAGPLLLEEPELSLHPEVIHYLPQMFARLQRRSGRQILMSSHSSELLRDEGIGLNQVLLLKPTKEGTQVTPASDLQQVADLLEGGVPLAEAILPFTAPEQAGQLALFGEEE